MGQVPAREARAASERTRTGWDHAITTEAATTAPTPVSCSSSGGRVGDDLGDAGPVGGQVGAECSDPAREAHSLGSAGPAGQVLLSLTPAGNRGQLGGAEGGTGVDAEVNGA